jgi:hypothetical protein
MSSGRSVAMDRREQVRRMFQLTTGKPVRWSDTRTSRGDFEGRDATLEVFDVPEDGQWALFRRLLAHRRAASEKMGSKVALVFHTPAETERLYAWVRAPERDEGSESDRFLMTCTRTAHVARDVDPMRSPTAPPRRSVAPDRRAA